MYPNVSNCIKSIQIYKNIQKYTKLCKYIPKYQHTTYYKYHTKSKPNLTTYYNYCKIVQISQPITNYPKNIYQTNVICCDITKHCPERQVRLASVPNRIYMHAYIFWAWCLSRSDWTE